MTLTPSKVCSGEFSPLAPLGDGDEELLVTISTRPIVDAADAVASETEGDALAVHRAWLA